MKILLDHNVPVSLRDLLPDHEVTSTRAMAWDLLQNGLLLKSAEEAGFDVLLTADQSIFYQQNNQSRRIALVVTSTNYRPALELSMDRIESAISASGVGSFQFVPIPVLEARTHKRE